MIDIDQEVFNIIKEYQATIPVSVVGLANALGIKIYHMHNWSPFQSGMIERNSDGDYFIFVNHDHPNVRQRFTIAHEIAHWALHKEHIGNRLSDDALYRSGLPNGLEIEANQLAAEILMPRAIVDEYWKDPTCGDVKRMASVFQVSEQAMAIRLGVPN